MYFISSTFATFHVPKSAFIELAPEKVPDQTPDVHPPPKVVTAVVTHESKPSPVNVDARWNVPHIV